MGGDGAGGEGGWVVAVAVKRVKSDGAEGGWVVVAKGDGR